MGHALPLCWNCECFILLLWMNSKERSWQRSSLSPLPITENCAEGAVCDLIVVMLVAPVLAEGRTYCICPASHTLTCTSTHVLHTGSCTGEKHALNCKTCRLFCQTEEPTQTRSCCSTSMGLHRHRHTWTWGHYPLLSSQRLDPLPPLFKGNNTTVVQHAVPLVVLSLVRGVCMCEHTLLLHLI